MEDFGVPVKEELVALDHVVVAQLQLLAVVGACGQPAHPGLGVPGGQPVGQLVRLQRSTGETEVSGNKWRAFNQSRRHIRSQERKFNVL